MLSNDPLSRYWDIIEQVLKTGEDGDEIIKGCHSDGIIQALAAATRDSPHAIRWRRIFGTPIPNEDKSKATCVLDIARRVIHKYRIVLEASEDLRRQHDEHFVSALKVVANCCADNDANRKVILESNGLSDLLALAHCVYEPNVLIPTIFNVCVDYEGEASYYELVEFKSLRDQYGTNETISVSAAEEQLCKPVSIKQETSHSTAEILLNSRLWQACDESVQDLLAELVDMSTRPARLSLRFVVPDEGKIAQLVEALLTDGMRAAKFSSDCRISTCNAILNVLSQRAAQTVLISSGAYIQDLVWLPVPSDQSCDVPTVMDGGDDDSVGSNEVVANVQKLFLQLIYDLTALPQFCPMSSLGLARWCISNLSPQERIVNGVQQDAKPRPEKTKNYLQSAWLAILYKLCETSITSVWLVRNEKLLAAMIPVLTEATSPEVLYPAVSLAAKLATFMPIRHGMIEGGMLDTIPRLLMLGGIGYETPLRTVFWLEILVQGQMEHVNLLMNVKEYPGQAQRTSILDAVLFLYSRGNDDIRNDIGRLFIEICVTISQGSSGFERQSKFDALFEPSKVVQWTEMLIFFGGRLKQAQAPQSVRFWLALGIFSTHESGRFLVLSVLKDVVVRQNLLSIADLPRSETTNQPVVGNVKFMLHHMLDSVEDQAVVNEDVINDLKIAAIKSGLQN